MYVLIPQKAFYCITVFLEKYFLLYSAENKFLYHFSDRQGIVHQTIGGLRLFRFFLNCESLQNIYTHYSPLSASEY